MEYRAIHYLTGKPVVIVTRGGRIAAIRNGRSGGRLPLVGPPLLDMQVNGYMGRDINAPATASPKDLAEITRIFTKIGVAFWVPTLITNSPAGLITLLGVIRRAIDTMPAVRKAVPGIHMEGPFITPDDGPRGAHDRRFVRPPSLKEYRAWQKACGGMVRIVTIAPEWPGAATFTRAVVRDGVVVALGHCNADREAIKRCVDAGASLATHLGNGAHPLVPRHHSYIWELLADDRVWAGLIGDGFHLPQAQFQNFIRAKRPERVVLTSDTVYLGGMKPGNYKLGDLPVRMRPDGKIVVAANEALMGGASQPLPMSITNAVKLAGRTPAEAWMMASENPAAMLGRQAYPGLRKGDAAVFNLFRFAKDGTLKIERLVDERK
ncbi:MAG: N-acetylglucosamine-6-phosphate deacetylase [Planctomycetota bacterium]